MAKAYQRPTASETDDQGNEMPNANKPQANGEEAAPETSDNKPAGLTITFKDVQGGEVSFKLKATTKMKKAMDAYADRTNRERRTLRFLFEGVRVQDDMSPESLSMEDGDSVDVHTEQVGGGDAEGC